MGDLQDVAAQPPGHLLCQLPFLFFPQVPRQKDPDPPHLRHHDQAGAVQVCLPFSCRLPVSGVPVAFLFFIDQGNVFPGKQDIELRTPAQPEPLLPGEQHHLCPLILLQPQLFHRLLQAILISFIYQNPFDFHLLHHSRQALVMIRIHVRNEDPVQMPDAVSQKIGNHHLLPHIVIGKRTASPVHQVILPVPGPEMDAVPLTHVHEYRVRPELGLQCRQQEHRQHHRAGCLQLFPVQSENEGMLRKQQVQQQVKPQDHESRRCRDIPGQPSAQSRQVIEPAHGLSQKRTAPGGQDEQQSRSGQQGQQSRHHSQGNNDRRQKDYRQIGQEGRQ